MKLKECTTCGSHSFTGNKCDYCGNVYEILEEQEQELDFPEMDETGIFDEVEFKDTPAGKKTLKVMIWILISIIWFAITVCVPPLFLLTICGLIVWVCRKVCKKY